MPEHIPLPASEQEMRTGKFRELTSRRIEALLQAGTSLQDLAGLMHAEEFLSREPGGAGRAPVFHFNAQAFIDHEIAASTYRELPVAFTHTAYTILPPGEGEIARGSGVGIEQTEIIPRALALVEVLSELHQPYGVIEGANDSRMMRQLSYVVFIIPEMRRIVFVNDEGGNATFIAYNVEREETWKQLAHATKDELKDLPNIATLIYPGSINAWKEKVKELLLRAIPPEKTSGAELAESEEAPSGWVSYRDLASRLGIDRSTLRTLVKPYRYEHPGWFGDYRRAHRRYGRAHEFYHPDLVVLVEKEVGVLGKTPKPKGWLTKKTIESMLGVSKRTFAEMAERYRPDHPDWFKAAGSSKKPATYYSPELVAVVRSEIESKEKPPFGWKTVTQSADEMGISPETLITRLESYRTTHPQWFKQYASARHRDFEYLHPDLIGLIASSVKEYAPEGWLSLGQIIRTKRVGYDTVRAFIDSHRQQHPDWFKHYRTSRGYPTEFSHPEAIAQLQEEIERRKL